MASQPSSIALHRTVVVLLCVMIFAGSAVEASKMVVGGSGGWKLGNSFGHMTIKRGDSLVFNYAKKYHDVLQVTAANYNSCGVSKPIKKYSSGKDSIKFSSAGTYYFMCGFPKHCGLGMKVSVSVK